MKGKLNFIIDALMFLLMAAVAGLGFLMKYILVPGKDRAARFGRQVDLYFLNWDRHEWGTLHLILGYILLALLVLHIVLHWQSVQCLFRRLVGKKPWRIALTVAFSLFCLFLLLFPFGVTIRVEDVKPGQGHHAVLHSPVPDSTGNYFGDEPAAAELPRKHAVPKNRFQSNVEIQGSMTLREASNRYDIPLDVILSELKIPDAINPNATLGRLKKKYAFRMSDVEMLIREYRRKNGGRVG